jgi:histidinol-phosphate aminotransferase
MESLIKPPQWQHALPGILGLQAYSPGMPVEELQRRLGLSDVIKLASNENPLGPSPRVKAVLSEAVQGNLALYPDGSGHALKQALSRYHGIEPGRITLGNGSNDLLEFLGRIYLGPGRSALFSAHAFAVYALVAQAQNAAAVVVPAQPANADQPYGHDLAAFGRALQAHPEVALVFIANPNNPTGTWLAADAIEAFLERVPPQVIVAYDEAYYDYMAPALRGDSRAWLERFPNLVVCRTFSKAYGIAGLRAGYALSSPEVADLLNRVRQPFNLNSLALLAAEAALADQDHVATSVALNTRERERLTAACRALGLTVLPSEANFITVDFGRDASPIHQGLLERGVIVRPMGSYGMPSFLRISVGTEHENRRFLDALAATLA